MMIQEIKLLLFVLSLVYTIRYIFEFVMKLITDNSEPIRLSKTEGVALYFAISYIITYILI